LLGVDDHLETSSPPRGSAKEAASLQGEDHLVNARRGDGKEALQVGLGGRASIDLRVGMDERQVLSLSFGESGGWVGGDRHGAWFLIDGLQHSDGWRR